MHNEKVCKINFICNSKKHISSAKKMTRNLLINRQISLNLWSELVEITSANSFHSALVFISPPANTIMCTSFWGRAKVCEVHGIKHLEDILPFYWRHLVSSKQDIHEQNWILEITGPTTSVWNATWIN